MSELLHSESFVPLGKEPQPDFCVVKNGVQISIECTTTNPTNANGKDELIAYKAINEEDIVLEDVRARQENQLPIRVGAALRAKMLHRLNKKSDPKAYWELPHVAGHPFLLAI